MRCSCIQGVCLFTVAMFYLLIFCSPCTQRTAVLCFWNTLGLYISTPQNPKRNTLRMLIKVPVHCGNNSYLIHSLHSWKVDMWQQCQNKKVGDAMKESIGTTQLRNFCLWIQVLSIRDHLSRPATVWPPSSITVLMPRMINNYLCGRSAMKTERKGCD